MIAYILKSTACLLLLLGAYYLFLEREKMHRFNRFFLLFALVFSLAIPLFTINIGSPAELSQQIDELNSRLTAEPLASMDSGHIPKTQTDIESNEPKASPIESAVPWLLLFYMIISSVTALRLVRNLYLLWSKIRSNPQVSFGPSILVLIDSDSVPHSFFRYIFVDRQLYKSGNIDEAVLAHEQAHGRQLHSLDIIFIELLKIAFWFNPMLYFYKKAIQTNHEFLADEAVIAKSSNVQNYQKLLLKMQSGDPELQLASSIKYSLTKKRIIMMTKTTHRFRMICKQLALAPILAGLVFAFSIRTVSAQNVEQMTLTELIDTVNQRLESTESLSAEEQKKLQALMSRMQEKFMPEPPPPTKPDVPAPVPKPKPPKSLLLEQLPFELKAPPPASKEDSAAIAKISDKYNANILEYLEIPATSQNYERLKSSFEKIKALQQEYTDTYKTIYKKYEQDPPPAVLLLSPPKPDVRIKTHSSKNPPLPRPRVPPPPPAKVDTTRYMQIVEKYSEQIQVYLDITPSPQNRAKLKEPYKELTELYKEGMNIYKKLKKRNEDLRPIAPTPMNPESRMQVYYRQNFETVKKDTAILNRVADQYAQLLQKYSEISPVSEGNLKYIYKKLTIYHDNWHKIFANTEGVAELAPLPTSPKERIEAYSEKDSGN